MALSKSKLKDDLISPLSSAFKELLTRGIVQANFKKIDDGEVVLDRATYDRTLRETTLLANDTAKKLADELAGIIVSNVKMADVTCTILPSSINVIGSPSAQVGPPTPLNISGGIR